MSACSTSRTRRHRSCRPTTSNRSCARRRGCAASQPTGSISRAAWARRSRIASLTPRARSPPTRWWCAPNIRLGSAICARRHDRRADARSCMPAVAGIDRAPLEEFLIHEARLLDERRFREWMELFAEDGTYWVPAAPDQASPFDQASLFYDDRELMKTRVERLEHPRIHVQTPPS